MIPSFPTLEKTWTYQVNQIIPKQKSAKSFVFNFIFLVKKTLVNSGKWSVVASSVDNQASSSDLWTESLLSSWLTEIPFAYDSYIILRNVSIDLVNQKFDLKITVTSSGSFNIYAAPLGYDQSGNLLTPSAGVNYKVLISSGYSDITLEKSYLHHIQSSDGQCTRIIGTSLGKVKFLLILDKFKSSVSESILPIPFYTIYGIPASSYYSNVPTSFTYSSPEFYTKLSPITSNSTYTSSNLNLLYLYPSDYFHTNNFINMAQLSKIKLYSFPSQNLNGFVGDCYDLWKAPSSIPNGTILSSSANSSNQGNLIVFSGINGGSFYQTDIKANLVFPWNNSIPLMG